MIRTNQFTGETEVVPSQSQVRKKGPCTTAAHGPCFVVATVDHVTDSMNLLFWNNYGYVVDWFPTDPSFPAGVGTPLTGCQWNKLVRKFVSNGDGGAPLLMGAPLYYRV